MRGDGFQVELVLFKGNVLACCSGEAGVVGAEKDHLSLNEMSEKWDAVEGGLIVKKIELNYVLRCVFYHDGGTNACGCGCHAACQEVHQTYHEPNRCLTWRRHEFRQDFQSLSGVVSTGDETLAILNFGTL